MPINIIENHKLLITLIERKINLKSALEYMRKEAMLKQVESKYEWKFYSVAADCIEKELNSVTTEIERIEKE